jgi:hypothetical protein
MDTGSWIYFDKKLILDFYFCLKSGPVYLFQIFIIDPPLGYKIVSLILNKQINLFEGKKDVNQCIYIMIIIFSVNWILIITNKQNHLDVIHLFKLKNTERWKENENYVKQTLPFL